MRALVLLMMLCTALGVNAEMIEARVKLADAGAAAELVQRVESFLLKDGVTLLGFDQLKGWFPDDVEQMAADKDSDFEAIFEEYTALKQNMHTFKDSERITRTLTEGVLDFAVEACDPDADGLVDVVIQDNRGLIFFFAGKGGEPIAAMHAPVLDSTAEEVNVEPPVGENIAARMKFSVEDNCLYIGYEPNSGAISSYMFKDGKLVEDLDPMESFEP